MIGSKPSNTPMILNVKLGLEYGEFLEDLKRYRHLVGKFNYFTITRPNITFFNMCSKSIYELPKNFLSECNHAYLKLS